MIDNISSLQDAQTIVVKVGSSLVTNEGEGVDLVALNNWAAQIAALKNMGKKVVLVSSGAIAEGLKRLQWQVRPKAINELQAAAAVGQMGLAQAYEQVFSKQGIQTAQILLTHEDLADRTRYLNAKSTLKTLLDLNILPIINENDTVTTTEIKLGDNDTLGALVTNLLEADALVILTDQVGLFDSDPRKNPEAKFISHAQAGLPELEQMAGGAGSAVGTGGMYTKIIAAKRAAVSGAATVIASGHEANVLVRLAQGEAIGTFLSPSKTRLNARQQWLMSHLHVSGQISIDQGAALAMTQRHSSLLPIGCVSVSGDFLRGEVIAILNPNGAEIARGLINYSAQEVRKLCRTPSHQIEAKLGYRAEEELIHRDNLVMRLSYASNKNG